MSITITTSTAPIGQSKHTLAVVLGLEPRSSPLAPSPLLLPLHLLPLPLQPRLPHPALALLHIAPPPLALPLPLRLRLHPSSWLVLTPHHLGIPLRDPSHRANSAIAARKGITFDALKDHVWSWYFDGGDDGLALFVAQAIFIAATGIRRTVGRKPGIGTAAGVRREQAALPPSGRHVFPPGRRLAVGTQAAWMRRVRAMQVLCRPWPRGSSRSVGAVLVRESLRPERLQSRQHAPPLRVPPRRRRSLRAQHRIPRAPARLEVLAQLPLRMRQDMQMQVL